MCVYNRCLGGLVGRERELAALNSNLLDERVLSLQLMLLGVYTAAAYIAAYIDAARYIHVYAYIAAYISMFP